MVAKWNFFSAKITICENLLLPMKGKKKIIFFIRGNPVTDVKSIQRNKVQN